MILVVLFICNDDWWKLWKSVTKTTILHRYVSGGINFKHRPPPASVGFFFFSSSSFRSRHPKIYKPLRYSIFAEGKEKLIQNIAKLQRLNPAHFYRKCYCL